MRWNNGHVTALCAGWALVGAILGAAALPHVAPFERAPTRLAGYGCEGARGTIYAAGEDEFPRCAVIQPEGEPAPTFQLVAQSDDGAAYVLETGASYRDCMERGLGARVAVAFCEPEGEAR